MTAPENRGDPRLVQEVRRLVKSGDRSALPEYITASPPDELAEAAKWFAKGGRTLLTQDMDWRIHESISLADRSTVREMVTVAVSAPADAARFLPWREMAWSSDVHILMLLDVLVSRGDDWCRRFVAAAISRNAKAGQERANTVIRCCLPLILHFGVSTADFEAYPRLWAFYYRDLAGGRIREAFRIGPAGTAVVFPRMQKSLLELWDQDVTAAKTLLRCFEVPDALGPLAMQLTRTEWTVGAAVRGYLDRGTFRSEEVFGKLRTALARDDGLPSQRVLADVLKSCPPSPEEVAASIPLFLSTVTTAAGFLSFLAFGLLLHAPLDADDLQDLGVAVFGRTEKKPQELLVRHLKSLRTSGTYDDAVLTACWAAAAGSSDLKIRTMAESRLHIPLATSTEGPTASASLWGTGARHSPEIPRYVAPEADSRKGLPYWNRQWKHTIADEQYVDHFLRNVYHVSQNVRDWYRRRYRVDIGPIPGDMPPPPSWECWAEPSPNVVLAMWAAGEHNLAAHRNLVQLFRDSSPLAAIHIFRHSELAVQAGTVPYSLATPSYDNFRVELDRLVPLLRLFEREGWAYGEADMFQALLRLGPMDARLAADVPELRVPPLDGPDDPERLAGRILREWVRGGGFRPPPVDAPLTVPVPLEWFPSIPRELLSSELWGGSERRYHGNWIDCEASGVVPFWPDLGAMWLERRLVYGGLVCLRADGLAGATAGGVGQLTHNWFVAMLAGPRQDDRDRAVETVLELAARRQLSADHLATAARNCGKADGQPLGRLVRTLALVAYEGHLDCVWPALTALVMASGGQQKLPAGMPELLATCTELWDAIPAGQRTPESVPAEFTLAVAALAAKSSTKTALEAKRLASQMGLQPSASL
ncbi:hypothetical protein [Pseudarthrobacter albicanus]|uniref:hypothetical protein n=1 Tax=Pseudarthrobacter albicanus TaxID=2823873 RepID=UPI001BAC4F93|nr:hypothetical protein [Pseudarthrobacter albicanus]